LPDYIGFGKGCSVGWGVVKGVGSKWGLITDWKTL
jgi:hypothetical protein